MNFRLLSLILVGLTTSLLLAQENPYGNLKNIELKQVAKAPGYSEGPTWVKGEIFFCSGALLRVRLDGKVEKFLDINPGGTVLRGDGQLLICDNKTPGLLAYSPEGKLGVLADSFAGKPLNSLNDLTVDAVGNIYWTDPSGSSKDKPVGNIFRLTPEGQVTKVATGLAFPNGLDVDPAGQGLYVIESQSQKILRYSLLPDGGLGKPEVFYDLGGSGGDGCAFDEKGNLWVADFHRPETKKGRILVLNPKGEVLGAIAVPTQVVSNISFGGPNHDEIYCTTGTPDGVFHAKVGIKGFRGHPGKAGKVLRQLPLPPGSPASSVAPRKFGSPGGMGITRGWYLWQKYDPAKGEAEVVRESDGQVFQTRVLPWATTYRRLAYGGSPADLLPKERVNLFFNPDEKTQRGYLVHFQDELCQMKGHGHAWELVSVEQGGRSFVAKGMAGDKPLDGGVMYFKLAPQCEVWQGGKRVPQGEWKKSARCYLCWSVEGKGGIVHLLADDASLKAIQEQEEKRIRARLEKDGLEGRLEGVSGSRLDFMAYATYWSQANQLQPGQKVQIGPDRGVAIAAAVVSRKNQGTYGSGVCDLALDLADEKDGALAMKWPFEQPVRLWLPAAK